MFDQGLVAAHRLIELRRPRAAFSILPQAFAFYANLAGKDLTGQKFLEALESGKEYQDIFGSPSVKFSKTNHLATEVTQVQQVKNGRWVLLKDGLLF